MDLKEIADSTLLKAVGHDPRENTLTIQFHNDRIWRFDDVPAGVHEQMMESESAGRFFHQWVKPYYNGYEVTDDT